MTYQHSRAFQHPALRSFSSSFSARGIISDFLALDTPSPPTSSCPRQQALGNNKRSTSVSSSWTMLPNHLCFDLFQREIHAVGYCTANADSMAHLCRPVVRSVLISITPILHFPSYLREAVWKLGQDSDTSILKGNNENTWGWASWTVSFELPQLNWASTWKFLSDITEVKMSGNVL